MGRRHNINTKTTKRLWKNHLQQQRGVKQGDIVSLTIFNIIIDAVWYDIRYSKLHTTTKQWLLRWLFTIKFTNRHCVKRNVKVVCVYSLYCLLYFPYHSISVVLQWTIISWSNMERKWNVVVKKYWRHCICAYRCCLRCWSGFRCCNNIKNELDPKKQSNQFRKSGKRSDYIIERWT